MITKHAFDVVARSFKDIMSDVKNNALLKPFGGITVVLGGDFRQIVPVISHGTREDIVSCSLHKSPLWPSCRLFQLYKNIRLMRTLNSQSLSDAETMYADWIMKMGDGKLDGISLDDNTDVKWIKIPEDMLFPQYATIRNLFDVIYPNVKEYSKDSTRLQSTAILASRNDEVDEINDEVLQLLHGENKEYLSVDSKGITSELVYSADIVHTEEFLNQIKCSGMENHKLCLKIGCPVILLRNLNQAVGLCNGTRLVIKLMGRHVLKAQMLGLNNVVETDIVQCIIMSSESKELPFVPRR